MLFNYHSTVAIICTFLNQSTFIQIVPAHHRIPSGHVQYCAKIKCLKIFTQTDIIIPSPSETTWRVYIISNQIQ